MSRRLLRRWWRWLLVAAAIAALGAGAWLVASVPDVSVLARRNPETTAFIELRRRQATEAGEPFRLRQKWRRLDGIAPYLRHAVIHAEDDKFWRHEGVDWDAAKQAFERNWEEKRLSVGGSTITQQLAKNLYLSPSRSPVRKLRELLITRRLEAELPKRRILELYLNIAEWGPGVFGAEAAARHWFGKGADALSPAEAARLAVALPSPRRRTPRTRSAQLERKAARLVRAMRQSGLIDDAQLAAAMQKLRRSTPASGFRGGRARQ